MFVPNVFSFATEGKLFRYGSIKMPIDIWGPWRDEENQKEGELRDVKANVESLLRPEFVLDILQNFTLFATDSKHRRIKLICRYQQYFTVNSILARVPKLGADGRRLGGVVWHTQGSGKSLTMVMLAQSLARETEIPNAVIVLVTDRVDLDLQIKKTFHHCGLEPMQAQTGKHLTKLITEGKATVITTVIDKFASAVDAAPGAPAR